MKQLVISLLVLTSACASISTPPNNVISLVEIESVKLGDKQEAVERKLGKPTEVFRHEQIPGKVGWIYEEFNPPRISTTLYFSDDGALLAKIYDLPFNDNYSVQDFEKRYAVELKPVPPVNCLAHSLKISPTSFETETGDVSVGTDKKKNVVTVMWESPQWRSIATENPCPNGTFP